MAAPSTMGGTPADQSGRAVGFLGRSGRASRLARGRRALISYVPGTAAFEKRIEPKVEARLADKEARFRRLKSIDAATKARLAPDVNRLLKLEARATVTVDVL